MLKCPGCGRSGGPFRLRDQVQADGQILRAWSCPCGESFFATAGAEQAASAQPPYMGFSIVWNDRPYAIQLRRLGKNETQWVLGPWQITVAGPHSGPGTRVVTLTGGTEGVLGDWRLEPGWGTGEIVRRLKARPPQLEIDPEFLAHVFVRLLS